MEAAKPVAMRVAVDARTMGSRPSGVGMYLNDFLKELVNDDAFEFILITDVATSEYIKNFEKAGVEVHALGEPIYRSAGVFKYFFYVKKVLDEVQPDIFWEVNTLIPVRLRGKFRTMITIHDMFPLDYVEYFGKVYSCYFRWALKKTPKNTDMILYNSEQTKQTTQKHFKEAMHIPNANAYIIAHPLRIKRELTDEDYFLYIGNMEKRKGVDLLLKGYKRYREKGGHKRLILGGKMQEDDIQALLDETMRSVEGIEYLNYVQHEEKHRLYAACSCFLFPSKAEGFGMPIIEIMKFHKPVLVGDLPIYDEIVGDCINRFSLEGSEEEQIEHMSDAMLSYNKTVDEAAYDEVVSRYEPERLAAIVKDFMLTKIR